jgi:hypothetical protein
MEYPTEHEDLEERLLLSAGNISFGHTYLDFEGLNQVEFAIKKREADKIEIRTRSKDKTKKLF